MSKEGARPSTRNSRRPRRLARRLGQHFLSDRRVLAHILEAADVSPEDTVVEVGPGRGILTRELVKLARRVVAVEIDETLAARLPSRTGNPANLQVMQADARTADLDTQGSYKVVANLPYYAANPIVRRFLEADRQPDRLVVMVQREVAQSMAASPGRMTVLSVAVQFYGSPRMVCSVPPRAFRPAPKVHSAVVCIDVCPDARKRVDDESRFFELVRAGFAAPRKQLRNSLAQGLRVAGTESSELLERTGIDAQRRPGTLTVEEWISLYKALPSNAMPDSACEGADVDS